MVREISLDTETTGLDYNEDRIVEIGCVEMIDSIATENFYHVFLNPEREVSEKAREIHGLTYEKLKDKPLFKDIVDDFLKFIGNDALVIHNAKFDMNFINLELKKIGYDPLPMERAIDTCAMAKNMFPGGGKSLDELCRRFNIDNSSRVLHGALLDAQLLSEVYFEMKGGKEPTFLADVGVGQRRKSHIGKTEKEVDKVFRKFPVSDEELRLHKEFMKEVKNAVWDS